uniref:Uncharacterized protein n=1 Tax=Oreochromis aureus TaxID=47969 RepID=A0AAZ1XG80_OREAU
RSNRSRGSEVTHIIHWSLLLLSWGAVGFTSAGIAVGSYAASMMSSAAVANGGGVAAGSVVAVLQSAATVGAAVAGAGAAVGWLASFIS